MTIIESIRNWIRGCPLIDENLRVNVDWLPEKATEYTIDSVPGDAVIKRYIDGSAMKQALFVFGSREPYGPDVLQNIDNSGFYEDFCDWVEEQNDAGTLPTLETGKPRSRWKYFPPLIYFKVIQKRHDIKFSAD